MLRKRKRQIPLFLHCFLHLCCISKPELRNLGFSLDFLAFVVEQNSSPEQDQKCSFFQTLTFRNMSYLRHLGSFWASWLLGKPQVLRNVNICKTGSISCCQMPGLNAMYKTDVSMVIIQYLWLGNPISVRLKKLLQNCQQVFCEGKEAIKPTHCLVLIAQIAERCHGVLPS